MSVGVFLDTLTILELASERIKDPGKVESIHSELQVLRANW